MQFIPLFLRSKTPKLVCVAAAKRSCQFSRRSMRSCSWGPFSYWFEEWWFRDKTFVRPRPRGNRDLERLRFVERKCFQLLLRLFAANGTNFSIYIYFWYQAKTDMIVVYGADIDISRTRNVHTYIQLHNVRSLSYQWLKLGVTPSSIQVSKSLIRWPDNPNFSSAKTAVRIFQLHFTW